MDGTGILPRRVIGQFAEIQPVAGEPATPGADRQSLSRPPSLQRQQTGQFNYGVFRCQRVYYSNIR